MPVSRYFARKAGEDAFARWQTLEDHLWETARKAGGFCGRFPWEKWAYTAGLWHDLGKYSEAFQRRLNGSGEKVVHATAGAKAAVTLLDEDARGFRFGRILAYPIAGHHSGLPDGDSGSESCLEYRLRREAFSTGAYPECILQSPTISVENLLPLLSDRKDEPDFAFGLSFFIRMLFSCVVDADRLNSEEFSEPEKACVRSDHPSITVLHDALTRELERLSREAAATKINRHRNAILSRCLAAAERRPGLFSLTVPTGGGKTLSSLAFALKHALKHNLERIIYVIPYTSIIEQNARVFRRILGENAVIEHHGNFDPKDDDAWSLAVENWDAPLIVTTNVQFFESLFSHKAGRCRKLHNIMNSVVILDEAQMLPPDYLLPCMGAVRELAARYNSTIVLCTATQPALNREDGFPDGFEGVTEIVDDPENLYRALQRTWTRLIGKMDDGEIAALLGERTQVLCIVNKRARARAIYECFPEKESAYHLSALMHPEHRTRLLDDIRKKLQDGEPCRVVSTQLIEAGVDIDFPVVFRELAGIDSIAQAAGRCNREGGLPGYGEVYVFESSDGMPAPFRQQAQAALTVFRKHGDDIISLDGVREYFRELYWTKGRERLDRHDILGKLARGSAMMNFPFREIGEIFRLISEDTVPVLIPGEKDGAEIARALRAGVRSREMFRKAQRYIVSVYRHEFDALCRAGAVDYIDESIAILHNMSLYNEHVGLLLDNPWYRDPESNVI